MSQSSQSAPHPAAAESAPSPPRTIADSTVARPAAAAAEPYQLIAPDGSFASWMRGLTISTYQSQKSFQTNW